MIPPTSTELTGPESDAVPVGDAEIVGTPSVAVVLGPPPAPLSVASIVVDDDWVQVALVEVPV